MLITQCFCNERIVKVWLRMCCYNDSEKVVVIDTIAYTAIGIINSLLWCVHVSPNGSLLSSGIIKFEGLLNATRFTKGNPLQCRKKYRYYTFSYCNFVTQLL